jgi:hypothetical protein
MMPSRSLLALSAVLVLTTSPGGRAHDPALAPRIPTPLVATGASSPDFTTPLALDGAT